MLRDRPRPSHRKEEQRSRWISAKVILFFLLLMGAGFLLTVTSASGFQDAQLGSGILLWVVGVFGAVYCIVRRLWGPRAAKFAVLALFVILLSELFSSKRNERDYDPLERRNEL